MERLEHDIGDLQMRRAVRRNEDEMHQRMVSPPQHSF
jgi:hypothetical protein